MVLRSIRKRVTGGGGGGGLTKAVAKADVYFGRGVVMHV
jgi:hypothetical protein